MKSKKDLAYEAYLKTGIYFVTCIGPKVGKKHPTSRCWGWYKDLKRAIKAIETNESDIHEDEFTYAVIEKIPHGMGPLTAVKEIQWFKWVGSHEKGKYVKSEKPEWSMHIINWAY